MKLSSMAWLAALFSMAGCGASPGEVHSSANNPIVTVNAGSYSVPGYVDRSLEYLVDRRTEQCWLASFDSLAPLDCCALRKVPEAASHVPWATDTTCGSKASPVTPAAPAAPTPSPAPPH
jgi:hypothetical protein